MQNAGRMHAKSSHFAFPIRLMRTRFAPSPTGYLHVGGSRTALSAYLLAKQSKGTFVVRIEDTDQERSVPGAVENMLTALHWAGIHPDEGVMLEKGLITQKGAHGPYIQSERLELYRRSAQELLKSGHAYACFCSPERLEKMRSEQEARKQAPMYDRTCMKLKDEEVQRRIAAGESHVLRLKVPRNEIIAYEDEIRGPMSVQGHTIDDQVLLKSDGFPTYHLAHVVDDHFMDISVVIRGEEWLSSTPKHLLLFQYLGWKPPCYAHVPLLLNKDRTKLSKRNSAVSVEEYIAKGYLPEAFLNFIALLGWNPGTTQEIFTLGELIETFSLERMQKAGAIFDTEKLDWLQGQWIRKLSAPEFAKRILPIVAERFSPASRDKNFEAKAKLIQERVTFFSEAPSLLSFFYEEPAPSIDLLANAKQKVSREILPKILEGLSSTLESILTDEWTESILAETLKKLAEENGWKIGQVLWPLRAALTGLPYSPGAYEVAAALGQDVTIARLEAAKQLITQ